ncbi:hypothetical protein PROVRETT_09235 [Providencia rettgeri DSM 1131]|nr:hypothetical protein PROVRETT_09235 [Providencia rettgeri DSM 1131]
MTFITAHLLISTVKKHAYGIEQVRILTKAEPTSKSILIPFDYLQKKTTNYQNIAQLHQ